tara:strand:- start:422 stop:928 length:507 start_codon:yes stop_codon:yes gene_type:complete
MTLVDLYRFIKSDIKSIAGNNFIRMIYCLHFNMQLRLILNYRIGRYLHCNRNFLNTIIISFLKKRQIRNYGCDISYNSKIGKQIKFPHPTGIVIGNNCEIGDGVMIWQNVTLGSLGRKEKKYPILKNRVKVYSGSVLVGDITIGENAIIGAMTYVNKSVKPNTVYFER